MTPTRARQVIRKMVRKGLAPRRPTTNGSSKSRVAAGSKWNTWIEFLGELSTWTFEPADSPHSYAECSLRGEHQLVCTLPVTPTSELPLIPTYIYNKPYYQQDRRRGRK
jgi:hypothetical protein